MGSDPPIWACSRIEAGDLVKECRALRPRFSQFDSALDRRAKSELKRYQKCAVNRNQVDRLEIRLALMGPQSTHYTCTFDASHLPDDFPGVRRSLRAFFSRTQRWRAGLPWLPYAYAIEGLHGDHRYHIHMVLRDQDISIPEVEYLWGQGFVDHEPVLRTRIYRDPQTGLPVKISDGGYRRLAEYLNKERTDGIIIPIGRHPWSCSRGLTSMVPAPVVWMDTTNVIDIPDAVVWSRRGGIQNDFGAYYYGSWIKG